MERGQEEKEGWKNRNGVIGGNRIDRVWKEKVKSEGGKRRDVKRDRREGMGGGREEE